MDINDEWDTFMTGIPSLKKTPIIERVREHKETPLCDPITISTKTKIIYLNITINLFDRFWDLPMIDYDNYTEGIAMTNRYKCLGNAFNAEVIAHILKGIQEAVL
jgi:hypothetical protein